MSSSNPLLESPAIHQAVTPLQKGLAEQLPQPRQGLYQGLKIKLYLSLNTPLLVLAAPFQVSPASPGKHVPIPGATGLLHSRQEPVYLLHPQQQPGRESTSTNVAAARMLQGAEERAGSKFMVRLLLGFAGNWSGKLAPASIHPNKHCIHMQSYRANDLSVVHLENRFHQPGLNDYVATACASGCSWR